MNPVSITINHLVVQHIGQSLPDVITQFEVYTNPMFPITLNPTQAAEIKQWLNQIIDRLDTQYVVFNGVLILSTDLRKF